MEITDMSKRPTRAGSKPAAKRKPAAKKPAAKAPRKQAAEPIEISAPPARKPAAPRAADNPAGRARGRPTAYTEELSDEICARLAEGQTLSSICRREGMPSERTVRSWALDLGHPFAPRYARAREVGYHKMADDLLDIVDDGTNDFVVRERDGERITVVDHEHIQRSRLRADTRKWLLSKALPKLYGDRIDMKHSGGIAIEEPEMSDLDLARRIAFIFGEAMQRKQQQEPEVIVEGPWPALVRHA
jgi:hypothetical protein